MGKNKYYVVWQGATPGIYDTWEACKAQVSGYDNARYKSFATRQEAEKAFSDSPWKYIGRSGDSPLAKDTARREQFLLESLAVDAACSGNPGLMEYRGVYAADGVEIFHVGPLEEGTNNIGEFLAIVHALALLKSKKSDIPIYSDSATAMKWVERKKCNTKLLQTAANKPLFDLISRAEAWLRANSYRNPIIKWETENWGEIPANFGRK